MPVLTLSCPRCGHASHALVMTGTRMPEIWVCGKCGSEEVKPVADEPALEHPWDGTGRLRPVCACCGG